jgi:hypothetical protein
MVNLSKWDSFEYLQTEEDIAQHFKAYVSEAIGLRRSAPTKNQDITRTTNQKHLIILKLK